MTDQSETGTDHCPACGEESKFYPNGGPHTFFCEACELEFWQEAGDWYCCDSDGEPRQVTVTDGGTEQPDTDRPDPEDDPFACGGCGCYIGERKRIKGEGYCDACLADMGFAVEGYR